MGALNLARLAEITGGRLVGGGAERPVARVHTDSRTVERGDAFLCLQGEHHDGHLYAGRALAAGAAVAIVSRLEPGIAPAILVPDTLAALGRLGAAARGDTVEHGGPLVVGITGTNGKTTTKELAAAALGAGLPTVASARSYNNAVGVPLTLLRIAPGTRAAVVEIGTNAPGEIAALTALARPEVGIITNVGAGHLAGLGTVEGVRAEKGCLLEGLVGRRIAILNRDDPSFDALAERAPGRVVSFGCSAEADLVATDVRCDASGTSFRLDGRLPVRLSLLGRHAASNALAALAAAQVAGVALPAAAAALAHVASPPGRLAVRRLADITVIDDTYNANPGSFAAALATVSELQLGGRLIVVAGEMLELGTASAALHAAAGRQLGRARPARVIAVGRRADDLLAGALEGGLSAAHVSVCADLDQAATLLLGELRGGDVILLKASRGVALDRLVSRLVDVSAHVA